MYLFDTSKVRVHRRVTSESQAPGKSRLKPSVYPVALSRSSIVYLSQWSAMSCLILTFLGVVAARIASPTYVLERTTRSQRTTSLQV